jgi:hypothetical protein
VLDDKSPFLLESSPPKKPKAKVQSATKSHTRPRIVSFSKEEKLRASLPAIMKKSRPAFSGEPPESSLISPGATSDAPKKAELGSPAHFPHLTVVRQSDSVKSQAQKTNYFDSEARKDTANKTFSEYYFQTHPGYSDGRTKTNQDSVFIQVDFDETDSCSAFAVFDGHGTLGHKVSEFLKKALTGRPG